MGAGVYVLMFAVPDGGGGVLEAKRAIASAYCFLRFIVVRDTGGRVAAGLRLAGSLRRRASESNPVRYITKAPKYSPRWDVGPYINSKGKAFSPAGEQTAQTQQAVARAKEAQQQAQAAARAKAEAEAERRKKDSILGSIKNKWNSFKDNATSGDWWRHKGIDIGIGVVATMGTGVCIATVVCGGGLFLVGAGAVFVGGLGAHMEIATDEERERGATQYLARTAKAEVKGMAAGALWGRGIGGGIVKGANGKYASFFAKRNMAGSPPLL